MSSGFQHWDQARVEAHNARIFAKRAKATIAELPLKEEPKPEQKVTVATTAASSDPIRPLNKTERAYLKYLQTLGVAPIYIQSITLKLAFHCRLTVDFVHATKEGRMIFTDVKGFQREDALIKMKMAARLYPMFDFVIVKRNGSGWDRRDVPGME